MKLNASMVVLLVSSVLSSGCVVANPNGPMPRDARHSSDGRWVVANAQDDATWIGQCVADNRREGASRSVVRAYCECMNDKMSENEMQSITQWETSHPREMRACERAAGWN